jgi:hypothetical protein
LEQGRPEQAAPLGGVPPRKYSGTSAPVGSQVEPPLDRLVAVAAAAVAALAIPARVAEADASGLPTYQQIETALVAQVAQVARVGGLVQVERLGWNHRLEAHPANELPNCPQAEKEIETHLDLQWLDLESLDQPRYLAPPP